MFSSVRGSERQRQALLQIWALDAPHPQCLANAAYSTGTQHVFVHDSQAAVILMAWAPTMKPIPTALQAVE